MRHGFAMLPMLAIACNVGDVTVTTTGDGMEVVPLVETSSDDGSTGLGATSSIAPDTSTGSSSGSSSSGTDEAGSTLGNSTTGEQEPCLIFDADGMCLCSEPSYVATEAGWVCVCSQWDVSHAACGCAVLDGVCVCNGTVTESPPEECV